MSDTEFNVIFILVLTVLYMKLCVCFGTNFWGNFNGDLSKVIEEVTFYYYWIFVKNCLLGMTSLGTSWLSLEFNSLRLCLALYMETC